MTPYVTTMVMAVLVAGVSSVASLVMSRRSAEAIDRKRMEARRIAEAATQARR